MVAILLAHVHMRLQESPAYSTQQRQAVAAALAEQTTEDPDRMLRLRPEVCVDEEGLIILHPVLHSQVLLPVTMKAPLA